MPFQVSAGTGVWTEWGGDLLGWSGSCEVFGWVSGLQEAAEGEREKTGILGMYVYMYVCTYAVRIGGVDWMDACAGCRSNDIVHRTTFTSTLW